MDEPQEPKHRRPNLTQGEKAQLLLMKAEGVRVKAIAEHFGITERGVQKHLQKLRDTAKVNNPIDAVPLPEYDYKASFRKKAIPAVESGLDAAQDPYKRANVGIQVLKGLGEFAPDGQVNIQQFIASVPPEWRERYAVTGDET